MKLRLPFLRAAILPGAVALALTSSPALAVRSKEPARQPAGEIVEKQSDLKELRGRIDTLQKDIQSAEGSRAEVSDQLRDSERSISQLQRDLRELGEQRGEIQGELRELGQQSRTLEGQIAAQQSQLEKLLYRQYLRGSPDTLQLLLNGEDPNQIARDLHYLAAIVRARGELLKELDANLRRKQTLAAQTREKAEALAVVEARQKEHHGKLVAQREQKKATLIKISARIEAQKKEVGALKRDEQRMTQLIERLTRLLAAQAEAARKAAAARRAAAQKPDRRPATNGGAPSRPSAHEIENEQLPEAAPAGSFARQKGSLRLPVRGTVTNRFGSSRQEGSTWKGLFIRSAAGSEIRAVAGGRVVFAEWMRGFGNLMIVDHGDSYLSIYGNNDALLKHVGDSVRGGDTIATVGNSGGNPESGLYFEIRHQGQPVDPLKWASLK